MFRNKFIALFVCGFFTFRLLALLWLLGSLLLWLLGLLVSLCCDADIIDVLSDFFCICNVQVVCIVIVPILVVSEHNAASALAVDDIVERNTGFFEHVFNNCTLTFIQHLAHFLGSMLICVELLAHIVWNGNVHDIFVKMELAVHIHRRGLANVDIRRN